MVPPPFYRRLNGKNYAIQNRWSYLSAIKEIYIDECYRFSRKISIESILDVGANLGFSVLYFKDQFPGCRVKAFEADPEIFRFLEANVTANSVSNVSLVNGAAWINDGELVFHQDSAQGGSLMKSELHQSSCAIRTYDLKRVIQDEGPWDLLKLDVEGAEAEIIAHIEDELPRFKAIFIEYHESTNRTGKLSVILAALEKSGFKYSLTPLFGSRNLFQKHIFNQSFDLQLNIHAVRLDILDKL